MRHLLLLAGFVIIFQLIADGQTYKDYRPVTTKYSDGTTMTLGGYGDPSQYSFANKSYTNAGTNNNGNSVGKKTDKKGDKELKIEMIELGSIWTYNSCDECSNANSSRKAYKKFVELINEKKYGEALDYKQKKINAKYTEENPDEMSFYRYYGLIIFCERQCKLKYPASDMNRIHDESIKGATAMVNKQLAIDLAKPGIDADEYKLKAYGIAGAYDEAKKVYRSMEKAGKKVDIASLIAVEINSTKPDSAKIFLNTHAAINEKLKKIESYTAEQSAMRATDESALGSFFIEILYNLTQVNKTFSSSLLPDLNKINDELKTSFITEEGKERFLLTKAYLDEMSFY